MGHRKTAGSEFVSPRTRYRRASSDTQGHPYEHSNYRQQFRSLLFRDGLLRITDAYLQIQPGKSR